jgi:isopenicillin N synthase-like dioxygenase
MQQHPWMVEESTKRTRCGRCGRSSGGFHAPHESQQQQQQEPPASVDMTRALLQQRTQRTQRGRTCPISRSSGSTESSHLHLHPHDEDEDDAAMRLHHNLQTHGWSPLRLQVSRFVHVGAGQVPPPLVLPVDNNDNDSGNDNGNDCDNSDSIHPLLLPRIQTLLQRHEHWKTMIQSLFPCASSHGNHTTQQQSPSDNDSEGLVLLTYRTRESGAGAVVEPKQSWEMTRAAAAAADGSSSSSSYPLSTRLLLADWMQLLHGTVMAARALLQLPYHVLLHEQQQQQQQNDNADDENHNKPLDLLRVFYYDAVATTSAGENNNAVVFGSSPHTDWGSFTVIWQDDVGGLETLQRFDTTVDNDNHTQQHNCCYCCCCPNEQHQAEQQQPQQWIKVPTSTNMLGDNIDNKDWIHLILHIGDITSLSMRHAILKTTTTTTRVNVTNSTSPSPTTTHDDDDEPRQSLYECRGGGGSLWDWPSPRHRVVLAPVPRTSLVYFAYPPPNLSLQNIQDQLENTWSCYSTNHNNHCNNHTTTTISGAKVNSSDSSTAASVARAASLPLTEGNNHSLHHQYHHTHHHGWYEEYSLLQNQSSLSQEDPTTTTAFEQYQRIRHVPLSQVLHDKWQQVQRA